MKFKFKTPIFKRGKLTLQEELDRAKLVLEKIYRYTGIAGTMNDEWCDEVREVLGWNNVAPPTLCGEDMMYITPRNEFQKCPICGMIYKDGGIRCTVIHPPGTCCHYGDHKPGDSDDR